MLLYENTFHSVFFYLKEILLLFLKIIEDYISDNIIYFQRIYNKVKYKKKSFIFLAKEMSRKLFRVIQKSIEM